MRRGERDPGASTQQISEEQKERCVSVHVRRSDYNGEETEQEKRQDVKQAWKKKAEEGGSALERQAKEEPVGGRP